MISNSEDSDKVTQNKRIDKYVPYKTDRYVTSDMTSIEEDTTMLLERQSSSNDGDGISTKAGCQKPSCGSWESNNENPDQFRATISADSDLTLDFSESNDSQACGGECLWQATTDMFQLDKIDHPSTRSNKFRNDDDNNRGHQFIESKENSGGDIVKSILSRKGMDKSRDVKEDEAQDMNQDTAPFISSTEVYLMGNNNEKTRTYMHDIIISSSSESTEISDSSSFEVMHTTTSGESINISVMIQSFD